MKHLKLFEDWRSIFKKKKRNTTLQYWNIETQSEIQEAPINKYELIEIPIDEKFLVKINHNDQNVSFQYAFIEAGYNDVYDEEKLEYWINVRLDDEFYYYVETATKTYEAYSSQVAHGKIDQGTVNGVTSRDLERYKTYEFEDLFKPLSKFSGDQKGKQYGI